MSHLFEQAFEFERKGDYETALGFYKQAAEQGDIRAQMNIGHIYRSGRSGKKNPKLAAEYYLQAAKQGAVGAQWRLGDMYEFGDGVDVDFKSAAYWYEKAAEQGEVKAQWRLAQLYENGEGVDFDIQTALKWYLKADDQNSSAAQWRIGRIYLYGKGVPQDYSLAKKWFDKANSQEDHPCAHLFLGYMCRDDLISNALPQDAIEHWLVASKHPHPIGEVAYNLGYAYYDGYGVERNFEKAKEYFEKAIEEGYLCSYALNVVKGELGELDDGNKMREYADGLIKKHIHSTKLYQQISKDLQNDFGDTWNITCRETKKFLETGMFTYFSLYSLGPHIYGNMDFSASITPMFKALEKELGKYLYSGYIEFLKKKEVSPNTFPQKRSFIKRISSTELAYRDPYDLSEFTLGNLHLTVGMERIPQVAENDTSKYMIDQQMFDYLNSIFKEDSFGEAKREREITDYIICLTQEVKSIADSLRNPAAHDQAMKIHKAEVCGNYIIKVQRILIDFLEKVKINYTENLK